MNLPAPITTALDALEACYPSYSAFAAMARAEVERLIREALSASSPAPSGEVLRLVLNTGAAPDGGH